MGFLDVFGSLVWNEEWPVNAGFRGFRGFQGTGDVAGAQGLNASPFGESLGSHREANDAIDPKIPRVHLGLVAGLSISKKNVFIPGVTKGWCLVP